jgi:hypothetical protein
MALETLKGVKKIGEFDVVVMDELRTQHPDKFTPSGAMDYTWFEKDVRPHNFVYVRHDVNSLSFTLQNGPVKEVGVNGCQVDTLVATAKVMIAGLDKKYPHKENTAALAALNDALTALARRKSDRESRGVEGTNAL